MLFSSLNFLFLFFPVFLFLYFIFRKNIKIKNIVLLIFSLIFYAYGEPRNVFLMIFSIIFNYFLAIKIDKAKKQKRKNLFIFTIAVNLLLLFIFKYSNFFMNNINSLLHINIKIPNIVLPIGISFYTFQTISYIVSVYKKSIKAQKSIINLGCYITAFPQLIAGPIVRYETVNEELEKRFGAKLAYIRKSKKLSQIKLAELVDMNFNYIGQIERGEANVTIHTMKILANALNMASIM